MTATVTPWNPEQVKAWLDRRVASARLEQAAADRAGYEARDDYDKAAAEEWACRALGAPGHADDQATFARHIKALIAQDAYPVAGVNDDERFERHVRGVLRRVAKMTKTNEGFANLARYQ